MPIINNLKWLNSEPIHISREEWLRMVNTGEITNFTKSVYYIEDDYVDPIKSASGFVTGEGLIMDEDGQRTLSVDKNFIISTVNDSASIDADTLGGVQLSDFLYSHTCMHIDDDVTPNNITTGLHTFTSDGDINKGHPYPDKFDYSILAFNTTNMFVQVAYGSKTGDMKIRTRMWDDTWEELLSHDVTWTEISRNADTLEGKRASDFMSSIILDSGADAHAYYPNGVYKCDSWINAPTGLADTQGVMVVINYGGVSETMPGWSRHYWTSPHAASNGKIYESSHNHSDPTVPWSEWTSITGNSGGTVDSAVNDGNGKNIASTYVEKISITNKKLTITKGDGTTTSSIDVLSNICTAGNNISIANNTISVTGLGSAAFVDTTAFAAAGHNHNTEYAAKSHTHDYSATYAAKSHTHTPTQVGLYTGSEEANTTNCPNGCWYGRYEN